MKNEYRFDVQTTQNPYSKPTSVVLAKAILFNDNSKFYTVMEFRIPCNNDIHEAYKYIEDNKDYLIQWIDQYTYTIYKEIFNNKKIIIGE